MDKMMRMRAVIELQGDVDRSKAEEVRQRLVHEAVELDEPGFTAELTECTVTEIGSDDRSFRREVQEAFKPVWALLQDMNEIWSPTGDGMAFIRGMQMVAQEAAKVVTDANEQVLTYTGWQKFLAVEDNENLEVD